MKKYVILSFLLFSLTVSFAQNQKVEKARKEITAMMMQQAKDWNEGNIDAFMNGYWKSDKLKFIGRRGITYGWQQTLENYKKGYPDRETMGKLRFELLEIEPLAKNVYLVVGRFYLKRSVGDASGIFSLVLKRFGKEWKIIIDHTS